MALGDGSSWDETVPTNATLAVLIDDYDRDLRVGVRSRMSLEHEWPSSQSATNQAGQHKYISLQNQATQPTLSGTQVSALYIKTDGATSYNLYFADKSGSENLVGFPATATQMITGTSNAVFASPSNFKHHALTPKVLLEMSASGTAAILYTIGISSVTQFAAGSFRAVFATAFANTNFVAQCLAQGPSGAAYKGIGVETKNTSYIQFNCYRLDNAAQTDADRISLTVWGSQ